MLRTFETHEIRKQKELSGRLWNFTPMDGDREGNHYSVIVPSCWESYPGFENYQGTACYETSFEAEGRVRLEFKGVSHMGKVFVDGKEMISHYNAYTDFDLITDHLVPGVHTLVVEVDNSFKPEYSLNRGNDYKSYGGISRGVMLEEIPETYINTIHVTPMKKKANGWSARVEVYCNNITDTDSEAHLEVSIHNTSFHSELLCIKSGVSKVLDTIMDIDEVETWSPEHPKLYNVKTELIVNGISVDDLIDRIGFRSVRITGKQILINEKPVRIKGFCRHEDHPQFGSALPVSAMAYDLGKIRDMGGNSVRTAHYPNDELFLDLCDEMGILVWEENHARGLSEEVMMNPYFEPQAEQVIREMIKSHYNHPCIYIWGILNECASHTENGRVCYEKQYELIRSLDTSRPCSSATCRYNEDICLDLPDVVAWNMYPYWYVDKTAAQMVDELYQWSQTAGNGAGKPFMVTEIGAGAIYGFRSHDHDKWSEEYQAEALEKQLTEVLAYENCMGVYIWQFCDNRVSANWFERRPRTRNNKGIVDEYRRPKLAYDKVKQIFGSCSDYWDIKDFKTDML